MNGTVVVDRNHIEVSEFHPTQLPKVIDEVIASLKSEITKVDGLKVGPVSLS